MLAVEGSEARREQEKGGMSRGVNKSVAPACVKIWSCVCPSRSYEMFPRSVKLQLAKMRLHSDIFRHKFMLNSGSLGFCCHITTLTCRGQHPRFYSLSFILLSRVHISVSSLVCTVSAPLSLVYRPQDSGCGPALSARITPISHIYSMLLIALYERSQLSCKRQLCFIRFMVVVSVGLLFLSQDLAYLFSKLEEVNMAQGWRLFPSESLAVSLSQVTAPLL